MEKVNYMFGKSGFLDLEPSTMIHVDSVSFLTSVDDRIQKYSLIFGFSWSKSIGEFSMVYKESVIWCGLGSIITIWACN